MVLIRLADGATGMISPVALSDGLKTKIAALGPVMHLIAPNSLHHMAMREWIGAFPNAQTYATARLGNLSRTDARLARSTLGHGA